VGADLGPERKVESEGGHLKALLTALNATFSLIIMYHGSEVAHGVLDQLHLGIHYAEATRDRRKEKTADIIRPFKKEEEN
jgi:hypothetical protein